MTLYLKLEAKERGYNMEKTISLNRHVVNIYGDGDKEYQGYYMVTINKFNSNGEPVGKQKCVYLKCSDVKMFEYITDYEANELYSLPMHSRKISKIEMRVI